MSGVLTEHTGVHTNESLFFQSEGTLLATGSYDGFARIWTKDGKSLPSYYIIALKECMYTDLILLPLYVSLFYMCDFFCQVTWPVPWVSIKVLYLHLSGIRKETSSLVLVLTR